MKKLILGMMLVAGIVSASAQTKENATSSAKAKIDKEEIAKKAAEIAKTKTEKQGRARRNLPKICPHTCSFCVFCFFLDFLKC